MDTEQSAADEVVPGGVQSSATLVSSAALASFSITRWMEWNGMDGNAIVCTCWNCWHSLVNSVRIHNNNNSIFTVLRIDIRLQHTARLQAIIISSIAHRSVYVYMPSADETYRRYRYYVMLISRHGNGCARQKLVWCQVDGQFLRVGATKHVT